MAAACCSWVHGRRDEEGEVHRRVVQTGERGAHPPNQQKTSPFIGDLINVKDIASDLEPFFSSCWGRKLACMLVSRARNTFRKSCDLAENQIRIGSPDEGFGIPIASV
jgi:hypothetical protein